MFSRFRDAFDPLLDERRPDDQVVADERLMGLSGYHEFSERYAGASFGGGLYRVHTSGSGRLGKTLLDEAFPPFRERAVPFAFDWLGRQFAIDFLRLEGGEPHVLLMDPGAGEALEIPASFKSFHNEELVDFGEAALASSFFAEWRRSHSPRDALAHSECVGYVQPLFLGGRDSVENLEQTDFEVYWALSAQLLAALRDLPPGGGISSVRS